MTRRVLLASLAVASIAAPGVAFAGKGASTGSSIKVETLPMPIGALQTMANDINDHGTVIVGKAAWKNDPGHYFAARWTRASVSDPWQFEDLRPLLPAARESSATAANDAGTVTVHTVDAATNTYPAQTLVISSSGAVVDLGRQVWVHGLDNADRMVGYRYIPTGPPYQVPLVWSSPLAAPEQLPVTETTVSAYAIWFIGDDIAGTLQDDSGVWLVRWTGGSGNWTINRFLQVPDGYKVTGINAAGRVALWACTPSPCGLRDETARAHVWDAPYIGPPVLLTTASGAKSYSGGVWDAGAVGGAVGNLTGIEPGIWFTPDTFTAFPHPGASKEGSSGGFNAYKQVVGSVAFNVKGQTRQNAVLWTLP